MQRLLKPQEHITANWRKVMCFIHNFLMCTLVRFEDNHVLLGKMKSHITLSLLPYLAKGGACSHFVLWRFYHLYFIAGSAPAFAWQGISVPPALRPPCLPRQWCVSCSNTSLIGWKKPCLLRWDLLDWVDNSVPLRVETSLLSWTKASLLRWDLLIWRENSMYPIS